MSSSLLAVGTIAALLCFIVALGYWHLHIDPFQTVQTLRHRETGDNPNPHFRNAPRRPHPEDTQEYVTAEFFDVDAFNFTSYPEYESLKHKPNVGLCFSGGGSRSFEASLGYLRGLLDTNLLRHVRYISSVSGGSWANAVVAYHDENVVSLEELLGKWTRPEKMTLQQMRHISSKSARGYPVRADLIGNLVVELLLKKTAADDIWVRAIHETFLKPAGIAFDALPAWSREDAARTLARNPHLIDRVQFQIPCSGRTPCDIPFPILNMAMLGPVDAAPFGLLQRRYVMMEATPSYVGFPKIQNVTYSGPPKTSLGLGGLVEPLGFSSWITDPDFCGIKDCPTQRIRKIPLPQRPFSIVNATSCSSWAPGALVAEEPLLKPLENVLITTPYFSPYYGGQSRDVFVGDGANMENQGLITLLQRGVSNICMFINTPTPLADQDTYHPFKRPVHPSVDIDSSFTALFGLLRIVPPRGEDFVHDHVFRRLDFPRVVYELQKAQRAGKGAVAKVTVTTVENRWWGVSGGRKVNVLFIYLGRVYKWEELLAPDVAQLLAPQRSRRQPQLLPLNGTFKDFPHFPVSKLHLSAEEANALADISAWVVHNNLDLFRQLILDPRARSEGSKTNTSTTNI